MSQTLLQCRIFYFIALNKLWATCKISGQMVSIIYYRSIWRHFFSSFVMKDVAKFKIITSKYQNTTKGKTCYRYHQMTYYLCEKMHIWSASLIEHFRFFFEHNPYKPNAFTLSLFHPLFNSLTSFTQSTCWIHLLFWK